MTWRRIRVLLYVVLGSVGLYLLFSLFSLFEGRERAATEVVTGMTSTPFWVLFIIGAVILFVWWAAYRRVPEVWAFVILLGITTFHWLFWAIAPNAWGAWFHGQLFWPMNAAIILAEFFASQQGRPARYAGFALWALLLAAVGVGAFGYLSTATASQASAAAKPLFTDITFTVMAETECSVPVNVPIGGKVTWASEKSLVRYEAVSQEGQVNTYPAPGDVYVPFPGRLTSVCFRTKEAEPVAIRVRITQ